MKNFKDMPSIVIVDPKDAGNQNNSAYILPPIQYPDKKWYLRIGPGMQPIVQELKTLEEMREWYLQQRITKEQYSFLYDTFAKLFPNISFLSIRESCCIIEKTDSLYPYIGQVPWDDNFFVAVGGNGHGARGSDEIGRLASSVVLGNEWDFPMEKNIFAPRFIDCDSLKTSNKKLQPPFGLC